MRLCKRFSGILTLTILFFYVTGVHAQTVITGSVKDAGTMAPLQYVSVVLDDDNGVMTEKDGSYRLVSHNTDIKTLTFSYIGYNDVEKPVVVGREQHFDILMTPGGEMQEIVVKVKKRPKYSNKDNPAVDLIRNVIDNKKENEITSYDFVQYEQYEKLSLSVVNQKEKFRGSKILKKYNFLLENLDTTTLDGKSLLPIYLAEKISDRYLRKNPQEDKTIVKGEKKVDYGSFLDNQGINQYLGRLYTNINIYDNNITILNVQFLSPIANSGPTFYRYYIRDTVEVDGQKLIQLFFTPRNPPDPLFRGTMFITLDGRYGVQKIDMTVSKNANLNLVRELFINQEFERAEDGRYRISKSSMATEFALSQKASGGIYGQRTDILRNYKVGTPAPDSIYNAEDIVDRINIAEQSDSFWVAQRPVSALTPFEAKTYQNVDSLKNMKSFRRLANVFMLVFSGYIQVGDFEIGNTNTFYSFNPVEGFRLKLGGRTTEKFSKSLYFQGYGVYGFRDHRYKYLMAGIYSFNHKSIYSYPLNYLKVSYQHETTIPGQELLFVQEDNFFLSFKRGVNDKWLYNKYFKTEYVREFGKNLSYHFTFRNWNQEPAGGIFFQKVSDNSFVHDITTTDISAELRWAPNEEFYEGKNYRAPIFNKYPVFSIKYTQGFRGGMNGAYDYQNLHFRGDKRFYLSQFGHLDATIESDYLFGKVPFPLLDIHRANQTYAYQDNSYNLMNFMEFVSDKSASARLDLYMNGFILNKVPVLKKLKLREVATFKILYGGLRDENNPTKNPDIFRFPYDADEIATTFGLGGKPYIEASVGVANIFKLVRIDLVKRFTYLDHPDISKTGIRALIRFQF